MADPVEGDDPEYRAYLRATVAEAIDYALLGIERGEEWAGTDPGGGRGAGAARGPHRRQTGRGPAALRGGRPAGRRVHPRRGGAASQRGDAPADAQPGPARRSDDGRGRDRVHGRAGADPALARPARGRTGAAPARRRRARSTPAGLDYEFDAWHLGLVVTGAASGRRRAHPGRRPQPPAAGRAARPRQRLGLARRARRSRSIEVERYLAAGVLGDVTLAVGEPRRGLEGWRLTHHEAQGGSAGDAAPPAAADPGQ